jgi:predicted chitinase
MTEKLTLPTLLGNTKDDYVAAFKSMFQELRVTLATQQAYLLGTAEHESMDYKVFFEQYDGDPVEYFTRMYEGMEELGNCVKGDGYKFRGRGFVQITGRRNYTLFQSILLDYYGLDIDLVNDPDRAAEPAIAIFILVYGCMYGIFTGARINDYINESETNFCDARRVVNGTDRAQLIAGYANNWLNELLA